jgi:N-acetylglucosaminyldiphosphoundecaprenol N-acetyl-beta-D-mannosaminyltransferase
MSPPSFAVFGTPVSCISDAQLARMIEGWASEPNSAGRVVCFSDAHSIIQGHDHPPMQHALATADIVVPDGYPVAWIGRSLYGLPVERTCGPDFIEYLAERSSTSGLRHYFFGGKPGVADALAKAMQARFPGITIVGAESPPMGPSSPEAIEEQLERINSAGPDVVWIALGAPKQEIWMAKHRDRLPGITLCGVGAAFDFHTGVVPRAPLWMRRHGLEWAYRWSREPKRLGPRYRKTIRRFLVLLAQQAWGMRKTSARHRSAATSNRAV